MKPNLSRNTLIGLAFIVSLIMIYFGVNFLKGLNVLKKQNQYYALFDDVSNLLLSSPVYVNGFQIGLINKIDLVSDHPLKFAVGINLTEDLRIPKDSYLEYNVDLFGASTVMLKMSSSNEYINKGDTITGGKVLGLMDGAAAVLPKADSIFLRVDSLLQSLQVIVENPAWGQSIEGIGSTMTHLNNSSAGLSRMIGALEQDIPVISRNFVDVSGNLKEVSDELGKMDLAQTYAAIDETVNNLKLLTAKINSDDNSLGLLLNDTQLHDSLNVTIDNAAKLLEDIRLNPKRYLTIRLRLF